MHATNDRDQLAPPRPPGRMRAVALAVLVHVALIGALTWGVNWKTSADQPAVEAELWSAVPQQAAPREVAPPPPPEPEPPRPEPAPAPPPPPPPPPKAEPDTREADIALEREKKRLEQEKKAREQQLQAERDKRERELKEKAEQEKKERLQKEKAEREKAEKAAREKAERDKAEREKAEREKAAKAEQDKKKQQADAEAKRIEAQRQENLRRMAGLAGATGGETATGSAQRSSGPSGSYGGKVAAKVRPNIVYPDAVSGNPRAEVEVRAAPDGTIVNVRLTKSSGNTAWDEAVVRALHKTDTLPKDVDGRVPSSLTIGFSPKD